MVPFPPAYPGIAASGRLSSDPVGQPALLDRPSYLLTVVVRVVLAGFFRVVDGLYMMTLRDVGVVAGFMMVAGAVVLGCRTMVAGGVFVMFCGFYMMFRGGFRHGFNLRVR
jgi:hypothetical protein